MRLSHSGINVLHTCLRKFVYRYIDKVEVPRATSSALAIGSIVHNIMENNGATDDVENCTDLTDIPVIDIQKGIILGKQAYNHWKNDKVIARELEVNSKFLNTDFIGYIDEIVERDGKRYICDIKTSGQTVESMEKYLTQLYTYAMLCDMNDMAVDGIMIKVVQKPAIRQKKTETVEEFKNRFAETVKKDSAKYFYEFSELLDFGTFTDEQMNLKDTIELAELIEMGKVPPIKNHSNCMAYNTKCDYYDICRSCKLDK